MSKINHSGIVSKLSVMISWLVVSSIFISICSFSGMYISFYLFDIPPVWLYMIVAFLLTYAIYSMNKLMDEEEDLVNTPERNVYIKNKKKLLTVLSMLAFGAAIVIGFYENQKSLFFISVSLIAGILYSLRVPFYKKRIKDLLGVKNVVVAISMTTLMFIPWLYVVEQKSVSFLMIIFFFFFIKYFINTVLFDIRDVEGDKCCNVRTLPVVLGVKRTFIVLFVLQSFLVVGLIISLLLQFNMCFYLMMIAIVYGYLYLIYFFGRKKIFKKYSFDLLVDGEWIVFAIVGCVIKLFI